MNKVKCLILLLLISITAISQEKGSYLTMSGGLGFQGFKYTPKGLTPDSYNNLLLGWNSGIGYSYFFTRHFGFSVGVGVSFFHSSGGYNVKFDKYQYYDLGNQIDDDYYNENPNMPFNLRARLQDWKEVQTGYTFDIPLMFLFQNKFGVKKKHGMYVGLGAKVQIPVINTHFPIMRTHFEVIDSKYEDQGRLNISGYYPDWHMEVAAGGTQDPQVPQHGYGIIHNPNEALGWNGDARVKTSYSFVSEIGLLYTITPRVDFMYGLYFDYGLNNIKADGENTPLMVADDPYHSGYPDGEKYIGRGIAYNGLMNSDRTDFINLVSYGVKVGLRIQLCKGEEILTVVDQPTLIKVDTIYIKTQDTIHIQDTIYTRDTIYIDRVTRMKEVPVQPDKSVVLLSATAIDKQSKEIIPDTRIYVINTKTNGCITPKFDSVLGKSVFEINKGQDYTIYANAKSYGEEELKINVSKDDPTRSTYRQLELEKLSKGQTFTLKNIYYDFNKYNIRPDAAVELDKLVKIMEENPTLKIELSSHTDSRGSDTYNMKLSQNRAEAAVQYIISKGISSDRIVAKGYGETKLVNECANGVKCSEAKHQKNRRTEILVTDI